MEKEKEVSLKSIDFDLQTIKIRLTIMFLTFLGLFVFMAFALATQAKAEEKADTKQVVAESQTVTVSAPTLVHKINIGQAWGVNWDTKGEMTLGTPATMVSYTLVMPIRETGWSWSVDFMAFIPNVIFEPAPRLTVGVSYFWKEVKMGLGFSLMDQLNPGYGDKSLTNTVGFNLSPFVAVTDFLSIGLGIGYRLTHDGDGILKHGLAMGLNCSFKLPQKK